MKICPRCQKTYSDETLNFCLDDGATLTQTNHADSLPATVVMNQPHTTNPPDSFGGQTAHQAGWNTNQAPNQFSMQPTAKKSKGWLWALGILGGLALICGGGFIGFVILAVKSDTGNNNQNRNNQNRGSVPNITQRSPTPATKNGTQKIDLSLWTRVDASSGTTEFINDELLMSSTQKGYYYVICAKPNTYLTENATTRITVRNVDEESTNLGFGLVIHSNPLPLVQDYAFLIDSENKKYRIVRHKSKNEISVVSWTRFASIKDGDDKNILEVRDENKKMNFYINGDFVRTIENEEGFIGGITGVYVSDAVKVAFSDFEVTK